MLDDPCNKMLVPLRDGGVGSAFLAGRFGVGFQQTQLALFLHPLQVKLPVALSLNPSVAVGDGNDVQTKVLCVLLQLAAVYVAEVRQRRTSGGRPLHFQATALGRRCLYEWGCPLSLLRGGGRRLLRRRRHLGPIPLGKGRGSANEALPAIARQSVVSQELTGQGGRRRRACRCCLRLAQASQRCGGLVIRRAASTRCLTE
jgi:hypothetical protein